MNLTSLLYKYCTHPENFPEQVVSVSTYCVVIKDKYPKATHHFLVLPRIRIPNVQSLTRKHLDILVQMKELGESVISPLVSKYEFKMGFHAIPSLNHLHLHIISLHFVNSCLKTKKHSNSFTTGFFLELDFVIEELQRKDRMEIDSQMYNEMLKTPLICFKCSESISNMPTLKKHLLHHLKQNLSTE